MIRFAKTDEDVIAIHRFLLAVAVPLLNRNLGYSMDDIDPVKSMKVVYDLVNIDDGAAIMAELDGELIGSLGMFYNDLWYIKDGRGFYGDRWFHVAEQFRNTPVGDRLRAEADAMAEMNDTFFLPHPKLRRRELKEMRAHVPPVEETFEQVSA